MTPRLTLLLVVFLRAALAGQSIAGVVQDSSGATVDAAAVTVMDEDTGVRRVVQTGPDGAYTIDGLPAGLYRVTVRRPGFQTMVRWNVKVEPATEIRLDFVMLVGSARSVITVEGVAPSMNVNDASVGTTIGRDALERLPLSGRGILSLVELAPGVVATPAANGEAGQFSANGLRANTNYFTVDGVAANTGVSGGGLPAQFSGNALPGMTAFGSTQNLATTEALEEVHLLTSSFAPEHGRLPGAQVALTTRSGSNQYHGSLFYALRNESLSASDWFANAAAVPVSPLRMNQWGATFGGPVRHDRTFVFASYEGLRLLQPFTRTILTPSDAARSSAPATLQPILRAFPAPDGPPVNRDFSKRTAQFSRPARLDAISLRVDHALTERVTVFGRYNRAPSYAESGFAQIEHLHLPGTSLTFGVAAAASPGVGNDVRTNIWSTTAASHWSVNPAAGGVPLDFRAFLGKPPDSSTAFYGIAIGGLGTLFSGESGSNHQTQWNLLDTLSVRRESHDLRLGIDYQRLNPSRETAADSVMGRWDSLAAIASGIPPLVMSVRAEQASALVETLSVFVQDTWSVTPRLNLTYGLRWELTPPPALRQPSATVNPASAAAVSTVATPPGLGVLATNDELWKTRYAQFAPRFGAAFRAGRSSVIRAGWGIFYDVAFSTALDPINGFPFNRWQFGSGNATTIAASTPSFGFRYASGLRLPYTEQWNIAYERMFGTSHFVSASYVGSSGRRLLRYEGLPQPGSALAEYIVATNHGQSNYHGLELQYKRRLARGLQAFAAYTWSHSIDNGSSDSGIYLAAPLAGARGSSSFDVRHNFTAALTYSIARTGTGRTARLFSGWETSVLLRARSGFPIDLLTTVNFLGLGFDDFRRPDLVPGEPVWIPSAVIGGRSLNPAAFSYPKGSQGTLGRNAIAGSGMSQIDLAVERRFALARTLFLDLRLEAYNALNHPNPADPVRFLDNPLFGSPASMLNLMLGSGIARSGLAPAFQTGGPRSLQAQLRLRF
jgi:hypothetical protein